MTVRFRTKLVAGLVVIVPADSSPEGHSVEPERLAPS
jgi:hypothetical protein